LKKEKENLKKKERVVCLTVCRCCNYVIAAGVVLGKHIPQRTIKWVSATIFLIFGLVGVYEVLPSKIGLAYTALTLICI
jgi:hypothetical protein